MTWLLLLLFVGCGECSLPGCDSLLVPPAGATIPGADDAGSSSGEQLTGWVVNEDGAVANAEVRLVALESRPCPCPGGAAPNDFPDSPECACSESLSQWLERVRTCEWPLEALARAKSGEDGRIALPRVESANALEVITARGRAWLPLPASSEAVALEVRNSVRPLVSLSLPDGGAVDDVRIRGAFLFENGVCVPLVREGAEWAPAGPLAPEDGLLIVDAPGMTPVIEAWYGYDHDQRTSLVLRPLVDLTERCESSDSDENLPVAGAEIRLEGPFHEARTAFTRADGTFTFEEVPAFQGTVTCERDGEVLAEWVLDPEYGLLRSGAEGAQDETAEEHGWTPGQNWARCRVVEVVDAEGNPVPDADVTQWQSSGANMRSGTGAQTDARGRACLDHFWGGGAITVEAPLAAGGHCAGFLETRLGAWEPESNQPPVTRVTLSLRALETAPLSGRVTSEDGRPIVSADVFVEAASIGSDCTTPGGDATKTRADGRFTLSQVPMGRVTLKVDHPWFAERTLELEVPGPPQELVLDRGASWSGRVLDPDGRPMERCSLWLTQPGEVIVGTGDCANGEFALKALSPGKYKLKIYLEAHPILGARTLLREIELKAREQREENVSFPGGETISGVVVSDDQDTPAAGVWLTAIPHGTRAFHNRVHPSEVRLKSDQQGRFTFRHLAPGKWVLKAAHREVATVEAGSADVRVLLGPLPGSGR